MKIHDCEQRSDEWYKLRSGIPTASEFKSLITSTGKPSKSIVPYAYRLAGEVLAGPSVGAWGGNNDTERGTILEDDAASWYSMVYDVDVEPCGFITNYKGRVGCSPDGLIGKKGMLEIKCLKVEKHIAAIIEHQTTGKVPNEHAAQVHGEMQIAEREWCDLVFHQHNLGGYTIRVHKAPNMSKSILKGIANVLAIRDHALTILRDI